MREEPFREIIPRSHAGFDIPRHCENKDTADLTVFTNEMITSLAKTINSHGCQSFESNIIHS